MEWVVFAQLGRRDAEFLVINSSLFQLQEEADDRISWKQVFRLFLILQWDMDLHYTYILIICFVRVRKYCWWEFCLTLIFPCYLGLDYSVVWNIAILIQFQEAVFGMFFQFEMVNMHYMCIAWQVQILDFIHELCSTSTICNTILHSESMISMRSLDSIQLYCTCIHVYNVKNVA